MSRLNIYVITQKAGAYSNRGYDTFGGAVVAPKSEEAARAIHPNGRDWSEWSTWSWTKSPEYVEARLIGVAEADQEVGVILSSFDAG